jgi:hypothetical protein
MGEKGQTNFYYMTTLAFNITILLMSVRTGHMMGNAKTGEEGVKFSVLASPIRLVSKNLAVKLSLHNVLKILKFLKHFRLKLDEIDPSKFTIIINKADIIFFLPTDSGVGPQTSVYTSCKRNSNLLVDLE